MREQVSALCAATVHCLPALSVASACMLALGYPRPKELGGRQAVHHECPRSDRVHQGVRRIRRADHEM